jgi:hypothetical protein
VTQFYSDPSRESDPTALPNCEVFYADDLTDDEGEPLEAGWYYWYCFPGCLPDSEAIGPFETRAAAMQDARDNAID